MRQLLAFISQPQQTPPDQLNHLSKQLHMWIGKLQRVADERAGQAYVLLQSAPRRYERLVYVMGLAEHLRNDDHVANALLQACKILLEGPLYEAVVADLHKMRFI